MQRFNFHSEIRPPVVVVGSTTIDHNVIGDRTFFKLGGVTVYAGITYRRHGLTTWVVSNVAPADDTLLERLKAADLRVLNGETQLTTRFVNWVHNGRRRQEVPSLASLVQVSQVAALADQAGCIHLGPLHSEDIAAEVYKRLQGSGCLVVLDIQGLVRKVAGTAIASTVSDRLAVALQAASIVKANEEELGIILDSWGGDIEDIMAHFHIAEWIVTAGAQGGRIYARGRRPYGYPSKPVSAPADPTGAGDVFLAAYTAARWSRFKTISAASRHAARVSSDQVAGRYIPHLLLDLSRLDHQPADSGFNCVDKRLNEG
jgi:sugar/nucleoside kinase (ribokinase family)